MVTALDDYVSCVVAELEAKGILENTLIFFTSDNGPQDKGGADPTFFNAAYPYEVIKRDLYDGSIHVPMIAHWPETITKGSVDDTPWALAGSQISSSSPSMILMIGSVVLKHILRR